MCIPPCWSRFAEISRRQKHVVNRCTAGRRRRSGYRSRRCPPPWGGRGTMRLFTEFRTTVLQGCHQVVRHGTGGRALRKCAALLRQSAQIVFRRFGCRRELRLCEAKWPLDELCNLHRCVDVRQAPPHGGVKRFGQHLVIWILSMQEPGEARDVPQSECNEPAVKKPRSPSPLPARPQTPTHLPLRYSRPRCLAIAVTTRTPDELVTAVTLDRALAPGCGTAKVTVANLQVPGRVFHGVRSAFSRAPK